MSNLEWLQMLTWANNDTRTWRWLQQPRLRPSGGSGSG